MVLFVTGGSRGIGEAIVMAAVAAGYDVAFTYVQAEARAAEVAARARALRADARCEAYRLDVRDPRQVEAVADAVLAEFETVDAVVSNAAVTRDALAATMDDEAWREVIDTNLSGSFYVARQFLPTFLAQGRGRFVFVSSIARWGMTGQANYAASKAGLEGLSGTLAKEYGRKGITSNVVVPGLFETDMTRGALGARQREVWERLVPSGRAGELTDVARAVLFLASDAAGYVNGQSLGVSGGLDWGV